MPGPTDLPRRNKRAKRTEQVPDPSMSTATEELETADLMQLGLAHTRELQSSDLDALRGSATVEEAKIIVELGPDPAKPPAPATVPVQRVAPRPVAMATRSLTPRAVAEPRVPKQSMAIVVLVYVLSAAALAASIYARWFA